MAGVLGVLAVAEPVIELGGVAGMVIVSGSVALACIAVLLVVVVGDV